MVVACQVVQLDSRASSEPAAGEGTLNQVFTVKWR